MKLHLGCGRVYLKDGFVNIDSDYHNNVLLSTFSESLQSNFLNTSATTLDRYYSNPIGSLKENIICDRFDNIRKLSTYTKNSVDEIIAFHVLEHFTYDEGQEALKLWFYLLKVGGILRICVPDIMEICNRILSMKRNEEGYFNKKHSYRLLFGSHNRGAYLDGHKSAWELDKLKIMFKYLGMAVGVLPSPTDWKFNPSIHIVGVKNGSQK